MILTLVVLISLFLMLYFTDKRRFFNAVVLGLICLCFFIEVSMRYSWFVNEQGMVSDIGILMLFGIIPGLMFILSIAMLFNSKILLEKEGRRVRNLLVVVVGLFILLIMIWYVFVLFFHIENEIGHIFFYFAFMFFAYTMFLYTSVMAYAILYHFTPILYEPNYIIVLGSGLIGNRVPPLLESRLVQAMKMYKKYGERPVIIVSGGQGSDEKVTEAYAMKKYLVDHYELPDEKVLMEDKSVNTEQNMVFSKVIMDAHAGEKRYRSLFVTNNFHVFRASIYAKRAELDAEGVGSKTAFYYIPNAFTREFIGLLEMYKWIHVTVFLLITIIVGLTLKTYV